MISDRVPWYYPEELKTHFPQKAADIAEAKIAKT